MDIKKEMLYFEDHFTHFLIAHADRLNKFIMEYSDDYYNDFELLRKLFLDFSKEFHNNIDTEEYRMGIANVVKSDWFIDSAIELFEENNREGTELIPKEVLDVLLEDIQEEIERVLGDSAYEVDTNDIKMSAYSDVVVTSSLSENSSYNVTDVKLSVQRAIAYLISETT